MKSIKIWLLGLCLMLGFSTCKKKCCDPNDPNCENYDPCNGVQEANADFVIEENVNGRYFIGDTVGGINLHRFRALHDADSFVWTLGAETIRKKQFERNFFPNDKWLDVQLIVYKKAITNCDRKQKTSDTLKKRFYSWDMDSRNQDGIPKFPEPIKGDYNGYYESNKSRLINVTLKDTLFRLLGGQITTFLYVKGFPYPNTNNYLSRYSLNEVYHGVFAYSIKNATKMNCSIKCFPALKSYAYLDQFNRDKINIEFDYQDTLTNEWRHDKFTGFRKK